MNLFYNDVINAVIWEMVNVIIDKKYRYSQCDSTERTEHASQIGKL